MRVRALHGLEKISQIFSRFSFCWLANRFLEEHLCCRQIVDLQIIVMQFTEYDNNYNLFLLEVCSLQSCIRFNPIVAFWMPTLHICCLRLPSCPHWHFDLLVTNEWFNCNWCIDKNVDVEIAFAMWTMQMLFLSIPSYWLILSNMKVKWTIWLILWYVAVEFEICWAV